MNTQYSFITSEAVQLGINQAIVLETIRRWVLYNAAHDQNAIDGRYFSYNTFEGLARLMPWWSERTVRRAVEDLVNAGALIVVTRSVGGASRVNWYSVSDDFLYGASIAALSPTEREALSAADCQVVNEEVVRPAKLATPVRSSWPDCPIYNINPKEYVREWRKVISSKGSATYSEEFNAFWSAYPRPINKKKTFLLWLRALENGGTPDSLLNAAKAYAAEMRANRTEEKYIKHSTTFLGPDQWWVEYAEKEVAPPPVKVSNDEVLDFLKERDYDLG